MPLGLRFQKALTLAPGMIAVDAVDEILLVCRRHSSPDSLRDSSPPALPQ
jgi:hypothetical protein